MTTFIAVYRGTSIADAHLIAVSADPFLVGTVADELLNNTNHVSGDFVLDTLDSARRTAFEFIEMELKHEEN